jgi:autotransporter-associated beta strand protein
LNSFPVYVDPLNPSRILFGGSSISETRTGNSAAPTFTNLGGGTTVAMAPAVYQGQFVADPAFPNVTDHLANSPDPDTIWITDGNKVRITKNRGLTWVDRDPFANVFAYDIEYGGALADRDILLMTASTGGPGFQLLPSPGSTALPSDQIDGNPVQDEVQSLVVTASGGFYRLRVQTPAGFLTTGDIPYNATTTQLETIINALPGMVGAGGAGRVTVSPGRTSNVITDIAVDPSNRDTAYVTVRQRNGTLGRPMVYRTTDAGQTWQSISGSSAGVVPVSYASTDTPVDVPDDSPAFGTPGTTLVSSVNVSAATGDVVTNIAVNLNIQMDFTSDLAIYLRGPNGVRVPLSLREGDFINADFTDTTFTDDAGSPISAGTNPYTGLFQPESPLSAFNGIDPNGTWSLEIDDNFAGDQARLLNWRLDVTSAPKAAGDLPFSQTWTVAVDPRSDTIYVGNDQGVWRLPNASSTSSFNWSRFGDSLPDVQVHDLVVNQTLNTITASTYGRGMYQLFLTDYQPAVGGIRVISGNSIWTGPITLTGDLTITADGTQDVQNGIAVASLDILGTITDNTTGNASVLTKKGLGTVMLSAANTYGGQTLVQQGVLRVKNPSALGMADADSNTVVADGAALELASDLRAEPVLLNGDGFLFNGHYTGAMRSIANNNVYTGPVTFGTNVTIGVDRGNDLDTLVNPGVRMDSSLRIGAHPLGTQSFPVATATTTQGGAGANEVQTITLPNTTGYFNLTFGNATTGLLPRNATAAQVAFALNALATIGGMSGSVDVASAAAGSGIQYTVTFGGALANTNVQQLAAGESAVAVVATTQAGGAAQSEIQTVSVLVPTGEFNLAFNGATTGVLPANATAAQVQAALNGLSTIGGVLGSVVVTSIPFGAGTRFTITFGGSLANTDVPQLVAGEVGSIDDGGGVRSLDKELGGTLILASANTIGGQTNIISGAIRVEDANALGSTGAFSGTKVTDGAAIQLARNAITLAPTIVVGESLSLSGTGQDVTGALRNVRSDTATTGSNDNTWAGPITFAQNPGSNPQTNPGSRIAIRVDDSRIAGQTDTLNIDTNIKQDSAQASFGLIKVGPGRLNLMQANSFTGTTEVGVNLAGRDFQGGSLRIENPNSLGPNALSNSVQVVSVNGTTGTYTLSFLGQTTGPLNAATSTAQDVENALNNLSAIGLQPEQQTITVPTAGAGTYTLSFDGQQTGAIATGAAAGTIQAALQGLSTIRRSEIQDVMVSATDGYFTLSYLGQRTAPLPFNIPASGGVGATASVENALNALSTIIPGSVAVAISPVSVPGATVFRVTFSGNANRAQIVSQTYNTDTVQDGSSGFSEIQRFALFSTSGTFTISFNGLTTIPLAWNATLDEISDAINALPSVGGVNGVVVVTEAPLGSGRRFTLAFAGELAGRNLPEITADGVGGPVTSVATIQNGLNGSVGVSAATVGANTVYTVTFGGDLANRDVSQIIAGNFTGSASATTATSRPGAGVVVSETPSVGGRVFTVTFQRPLDLAIVPQLVATPTSGLAVNVTTAQTGGQGAIVNNTGAPATLEIAGDPTNVGGGINVNRNIVLNGTGVSGSIRVASAIVAGGTQYTLTFDGALGNTNIPLITAVGTGGATTTTAGVTDGSRASNEVQRVTVGGTGGTFTIALNGRTTAALPFNATAAQVQAALAAISSLTGTAGALSNVSGTNTYSGIITLGSNTHIGATPNTTLNVNVLRDPTPLTVPAPSLTKVGQGTIAFPAANAYGGQTTVRDGVLSIQNPQGVGTSRNEVQIVSTVRLTDGSTPGGFVLTFNGQQTVPLVFGAPATSAGTLPRDSVQNALNALSSVRRSEVQTVTLTGSATGSFFMVFNGQQTTSLSRAGLTATQVQSALEALSTIGVGNVVVAQNAGVFTITFQGALANRDLSPIVASGQGGTIATAGVLTDGLGGIATVTSDVIPGGLQYTITFSGDLAGTNLPEVLVTSGMVFTGTQTNGGSGLNEIQTIESLISPGQSFQMTFNGQTTGPVTAPATAAQIKNALEGISSVRRNEVQDVMVSGTSGTFTIRVTTPDNVTTTTQPIAFNATAGTVQTELASLANVGAGNVSVVITASGSGSTTYRITFQGALGNRNIATVVAAPVGSSPVFTQVVTVTQGLAGTVDVQPTSVPNLFTITFTGDLANADVPQVTAASGTTPGFITARTDSDGNGAETQYLQVVGSNGTFRLSFRGQTTGVLQFFATAADVENALNALSTIGSPAGGFVTVTKSGLSTTAGGAVYTIHFGGTLGVTNLPAITTIPAGGITTAAITTGNDGPEGTRVLDGATLQLNGNMTMDREVVSLNGQGFMNQGALNQKNGTTTWQALAPNVQIPLLLESDSSIGTTLPTDSIIFQLPITDAGTNPGKNLDIYGPGTIVYTGSPTASFNGITYTQYTGTTTVHDGTLLLSRPGFASILGPLVVGDGVGAPNSAVVRETANDQVADAVTILVNSDGLFDLNTFQDTVGDVTVAGGHIDTGVDGQLTTGFIDMTGGLIDIRDAATVLASKNITMRGSTIVGGNQSTLANVLGTDVDLSMSAFGSPTPVPSVIDFGNKGVVSVRDLTMTGNSTIDFDDDGSLATRNITATGGHIGFLNKGSLIATGNVSGTGTNFTFGQQGLMNVFGNLTETNGTISFGFNSDLVVLGDANFDKSNLQFANEGTATIGGKLSAVNVSKIDFGDTGVLAVTGNATFTDSKLTMGDGADASTADLAATNSALSFGAAVSGGSSSLDSKVVTTTNSTITFGDGADFTATSINATSTVVDFGQTGFADVSGNVDLSASTIHFDDGGRLDALDVSGILNSLIEFLLNGILNVDDFILKSNSTLSMDKATATASTMDLTDSFATFGPGSNVTVSGTVKLQDSTLTLGSSAASPSKIQTGDVTMDPSYIVLGNSATANFGDMTTTDGSVTGADNVQVNAGDIDSVGTDFIFDNHATLNAGVVSVKNADVTFGTDGTFTTTGDLKLDGAKVTLGDRNLQNPVFTTQSIDMQNASVIALGKNALGSSLGITMAGSTLSLGAGAVHKLGGDVTASSTATDKSQILGPGTLDMAGADRNFAVTGPLDVDLLVTSLINSSPTEQLVKTGAGRLEFAPAGSGFSGPVSIVAGDVQVDTKIGAVNLSDPAASLSGTGTVGQINSVPPTGSGTVAPGVNWSTNPYGVLSSGDAFWGPSTTFSVNVQHASVGAPIAGVDNDLLASSGQVSLNGAKLAGLYDGTGVQLNDRFTILTAANGVAGKFAQTNGQDIVFIDGHKFTISYEFDSSIGSVSPNKVVLTKVQTAIVSMDVVSNLNPATQRQPVVLTATMVPETGSGFIPPTNTVTFTFTNTLTLQTYTGTVPVTADTNQATFNTSLNLDGGFTFLPGGSYTVTADYSGDPVDFLPKSATLTGQPLVIEIPVFDTLTASEPLISPSNSSSIGIKDSTTFNVNVINERGQLQTWSLTIQDVNNPSRTLVIPQPSSPFGPTGVHTIVPISAVWDGRIGGTIVSGDYTVTATFLDVFGNTGSSNVVTVTVDDISPTITSFTNDSPNGLVGDTGTSTPRTLHLSGSVGDPAFPGHPNGTFDRWQIDITNLRTGVVAQTFSSSNPTVSASWDATTAADGVYTITITAFDFAGNNVKSAGQTIVVLNHPPQISASSLSPTIYGNTITFTATATLFANPADNALVPQAVSDLLIGDNVEFYLNGATLLGSAPLAKVGSQYVAEFTTAPTQVVHAGTYATAFARYTGTADFSAGDSPNFTHVVLKRDLHVAGKNPVNKVYGDALPPLDLASGNVVVTTADLQYSDTAAGVLSGSAATTATALSHVISAGYPISQGTLANTTGDYNIVWTDGRLFVTKKDITLTIDDKERPIHAANPTFTFTGSPMVNGELAVNVVSGLTLTTTATVSSPVGAYPIFATGTATAQDYNIVNIVNGTLKVVPIPTALAVGPGQGGAPLLKVYSTTGTPVSQTYAFTPGFTGGVRVATGDFNRDGVMDYLVGTGPGTRAFVRVINGATHQDMFTVYPFENFEGGVYVTAGDIDGDGADEVVITPDEGGGPRVVAYSGLTFQPFISYFGIQDPNFRGGARAAVGDLNGDGYADIAVSAGFNGGPRISLWDGKALTNHQFKNLTSDFFAYDQSLRNGAYVAIGDVDGDGKGDLITGAGPGGGPHVKIYNGAELLNPAIGPANTSLIANFFAGNPNNRGGVRVAVKSFDSDLKADLATGVGEKGGSSFSTYLGKDLAAGVIDEYFGDDAFPGFSNGVYVG